jgi:hypothetical protein
MDGLTYEYVAEHMADEYEARRLDKVQLAIAIFNTYNRMLRVQRSSALELRSTFLNGVLVCSCVAIYSGTTLHSNECA